MESLQHLKQRLAGVENIGKITKAMELVAATKMRRSQEIALNSRPYAFAAFELLANLSAALNVSAIGGSASGGEGPPLLAKREIKHTAVVLVTSDKGLAGAFNSNIIRSFEKFLKAEGATLSKENDHFIGVGQKAARYLEKKMKLCDKFIRFGDYTTIEEVKPLAEHLIKGYLEREWDRVIVFSMHFRTALLQEPIQRQLFPVDFERIKETVRELVPERGKFAELMKETGMGFFESGRVIKEDEYLIEPSPEVVLEKLVPELITMEIYHLILEANASEHAARRAAMKSASDNASEVAEELTLEYNKSRQAQITKELTEISAGAEALK